MSNFTLTTATFDEHDTMPSAPTPSSSHILPLPRSSSQDLSPPTPTTDSTSYSHSSPTPFPCPLPPTSTSEAESSWWRPWTSDPPFPDSRVYFRELTTRRSLRLFFSLALTVHLLLLVVSIALLVHQSDIRQLLPADTQESVAFRILQTLPGWLLARSIICLVLAARRIRLAEEWRSSVWEAAWCVLVMWLCTFTLCFASLSALASIGSAEESTLYLVLWCVVAVLSMFEGLHVSSLATLSLVFPSSALTVNLPMVPLDQQRYTEPTTSPRHGRRKHEGLTLKQLQALPNSVCSVKRDDSCAVCMDDVEVGDLERVLRCGHAYHQPCIDPWLLKKRVCPLCVRAVRPSQSRSTVSEWVVEMVERVKPGRDSREIQVSVQQ